MQALESSSSSSPLSTCLDAPMQFCLPEGECHQSRHIVRMLACACESLKRYLSPSNIDAERVLDARSQRAGMSNICAQSVRKDRCAVQIGTKESPSEPATRQFLGPAQDPERKFLMFSRLRRLSLEVTKS